MPGVAHASKRSISLALVLPTVGDLFTLLVTVVERGSESGYGVALFWGWFRLGRDRGYALGQRAPVWLLTVERAAAVPQKWLLVVTV